MFIDFSPEKSLTLKQKLWKALKPGINHLYTTDVHSRGAQTRAAFGWWGRRRGGRAASPRAPTPVSPASAAAPSPARTRCRAADRASAASHRPPGASRAENVAGIWQADLCGPIPGHAGGPAGTRTPESGCKTELRGNRQCLLWLSFGFLMQLFNLSSWYERTDATFDFCLVWLQWHP